MLYTVHTDFGESDVALAMISARLRIHNVRRNAMEARIPEGVNIIIANLKPAMACPRNIHLRDSRKNQYFGFGRFCS